MDAYHIERFGSVDGIVLGSSKDPRPGLKEVLMRIRATSLNYRDLMVLKGGGRGPTKIGVVPLSDGAGEVAARRIDCFGTRSPQRGQKPFFSYVSCEARVPMDHPLRVIREIVNEAPVVLRAHGAGLALAHRRFLHTRFRGNDDS